jgi:transforming growth factor-beta-induced protein
MHLKGLNGATLFAPTNDAFVSLLSELGFASLDDVPVPALTNILLYHVIGAPVKAADVKTGYASTLSPAQSKTVSLFLQKNGSAVKIDNRASVVVADVISTNVIIHAIDKVILPGKIVQMAINDPSFSSLVSAVVYANLVDALNGDGPFHSICSYK